MSSVAWLLIAAPVLLVLYTYLGYPLLLRALAALRGPRPAPPEPEQWPMISITVPAYNEEAQIRGTLESLLKLDYPADRRQILVISDASSDGTDDIVREYADRGVELLRQPQRGGKGAAERAAVAHLRGEIVVNTDASIRIVPGALKPLIAAFSDPSVGLASGRDVSVARVDSDANAGESGYVGYEMEIRRLETRVDGIVGASGCFYAMRMHLHRLPLPHELSRDFASALMTRENGYRSVSVDEAVCLVPRTGSLKKEYRRKVRTITRGMRTLAYKRHLLNPARHGAFAWMLFSHKVCRWLIPWMGLPVLAGLGMLAATHLWAAAAFGLAVTGIALGATGWAMGDRPDLPRALSVPAFLLSGNLAALHAALRALRGREDSVWEPTRREVVAAH